MEALGFRYNRLTLLELTHCVKTSSNSTFEFHCSTDTVQSIIIGISSTDGDFKRIALKNGSNIYLLNIQIIDETCEDYPVNLQIWGDRAFKYKSRIRKGVTLVLTNFEASRTNERGVVIRDASVALLNDSEDIDTAFPHHHNVLKNYLSKLHSLKEKYYCIENEKDLVLHAKNLNNAVGLYRIRITLRLSMDIYEHLNTAIRDDKPKTIVSVTDSNDKKCKLIVFLCDIPKLLKAIQCSELEKEKETSDAQCVTICVHDVEVDSIYQKSVT